MQCAQTEIQNGDFAPGSRNLHRAAESRPTRDIESFPGMIQFPFATDMIDGFPTGKIMGQQSPLNTAFADIENRVKILSGQYEVFPSSLAWGAAARSRPIERR